MSSGLPINTTIGLCGDSLAGPHILLIQPLIVAENEVEKSYPRKASGYQALILLNNQRTLLLMVMSI